MNTAKYIANKMVNEYKVDLYGKYEGYYYVIVMPNGQENKFFVFTDTKIPVHIHNPDIVKVIKELIESQNQ